MEIITKRKDQSRADEAHFICIDPYISSFLGGRNINYKIYVSCICISGISNPIELKKSKVLMEMKKGCRSIVRLIGIK